MKEPLRLLIVEDQPSDAELMVRQLEREGFDPHWARVETEDAFLAELDAPPDLVLSDWSLPGFSGSRALELVRERQGNVPFIIVSGAVGEDVAVAAMHQGAADYVLKDRLVRLGPAVRRALDATRLRAEQRQAEVELRASEEKYRTLFEESFDGLFITSPAGQILDINRKGIAMFGYDTKEEVLRLDLERDVYAHPPDRERILALVQASGSAEYEVDVRKRNGELMTTLCSLTAVRDEHGAISSFRGIIRDITERKRAEEELRERERHAQSLLRLSRRLEPAQTYAEALEAARDEVREVLGYQDLWAYLLTEDGRHFKSLVAGGPIADTVMSEEGTATLTIEGDPMLEEIAAAREIVLVADARTDDRVNREIVARLGLRTIVNVPIVLFDRHLGCVGTGTFGDEGVRVPTPSEQRYLVALASHVAVTLDRVRLLIERRQAEAERARLAAAIEQSAESVVITDTAGTIEYVNPTFERVTGYARSEAVGENSRILKSDRQPPAYYQAMWAALTAGQPWVAEFVNRRKDGTLFTEEAVISPVRDDHGSTTGYVAVKRDVTRQRAAEAHASRLARERTLIADAIGRLVAHGTREEIAQAICQQVVSLAGLDVAGIFVFALDGRATPLAIVTARGDPAPLRRLPYQRSRYLRERAEAGPWVERWMNRPWHPYNRAAVDAGVEEIAFAPLRHENALQGFLLAGKRPSTEVPLSDELPALVEFAGLAGATLGPAIAESTEVSRARSRLSAVIAERAFHPVFQLILDTRRGRVVAYEALTRFDGGTPPDVVFAEAAQVGLGLELERTTLQAALEAARGLPRSVWLQVNASPALILAGEPLRTMIANAGRRIVLEVTEHTAIDDYGAFRAALTALGPRVSLAIDDAGAGFASLRHVLELAPAFVKLDRSLIEAIDTDPARQAMVTGLLLFARSGRGRLIAEGVETDAELEVLTRLGVRLAQGYLLGRPGPLAR